MYAVLAVNFTQTADGAPEPATAVFANKLVLGCKQKRRGRDGGGNYWQLEFQRVAGFSFFLSKNTSYNGLLKKFEVLDFI